MKPPFLLLSRTSKDISSVEVQRELRKSPESSIWGHGLAVALAGLGEWLDVVISEVFSHLSNSMVQLNPR